jgi:hypothetical protein
VRASWFLSDWSRVLDEFFILLSDSHSQPRAKLNLRKQSSATFMEKDLKRNNYLKDTQQFTAIGEISNAQFAKKVSKQNMK